MLRLAFVLVLSTIPAAAQPTYPGGRPIDCYCTDSTGGRVELEQTACLTVGSRSFVGRCAMSLNVPIWRDTGEACPTG